MRTVLVLEVGGGTDLRTCSCLLLPSSFAHRRVLVPDALCFPRLSLLQYEKKIMTHREAVQLVQDASDLNDDGIPNTRAASQTQAAQNKRTPVASSILESPSAWTSVWSLRGERRTT